MARRKREATFEVRFIGGDVSPEAVTLRAVSDSLNAVQDLASGRDPYETRQVEYSKGIGLVDVLRGSAVYRCVSRAPSLAIANLQRTGQLIDTDNGHSEGLEAILAPIQSLSEVAKLLQCRIEVRRVGNKDILLEIDEHVFTRISENVFVEGESTIIGDVKRAGGATGMKCAMRIPNRPHLLYCDVATSSLVRRLGQRLYQTIAAKGDAVWVQPSWRIYRFKITGFTQPKLGDPKKALQALRSAGLDAWDNFDSNKKIAEELGR